MTYNSFSNKFNISRHFKLFMEKNIFIFREPLKLNACDFDCLFIIFLFIIEQKEHQSDLFTLFLGCAVNLTLYKYKELKEKKFNLTEIFDFWRLISANSKKLQNESLNLSSMEKFRLLIDIHDIDFKVELNYLLIDLIDSYYLGSSEAYQYLFNLITLAKDGCERECGSKILKMLIDISVNFSNLKSDQNLDLYIKPIYSAIINILILPSCPIDSVENLLSVFTQSNINESIILMVIEMIYKLFEIEYLENWFKENSGNILIPILIDILKKASYKLFNNLLKLLRKISIYCLNNIELIGKVIKKTFKKNIQKWRSVNPSNPTVQLACKPPQIRFNDNFEENKINVTKQTFSPMKEASNLDEFKFEPKKDPKTPTPLIFIEKKDNMDVCILPPKKIKNFNLFEKLNDSNLKEIEDKIEYKRLEDEIVELCTECLESMEKSPVKVKTLEDDKEIQSMIKDSESPSFPNEKSSLNMNEHSNVNDEAFSFSLSSTQFEDFFKASINEIFLWIISKDVTYDLPKNTKINPNFAIFHVIEMLLKNNNLQFKYREFVAQTIYPIMIEENFKEMFKNKIYIFLIKYIVKFSHSVKENAKQFEICQKFLKIIKRMALWIFEIDLIDEFLQSLSILLFECLLNKKYKSNQLLQICWICRYILKVIYSFLEKKKIPNCLSNSKIRKLFFETSYFLAIIMYIQISQENKSLYIETNINKLLKKELKIRDLTKVYTYLISSLSKNQDQILKQNLKNHISILFSKGETKLKNITFAVINAINIYYFIELSTEQDKVFFIEMLDSYLFYLLAIEIETITKEQNLNLNEAVITCILSLFHKSNISLFQIVGNIVEKLIKHYENNKKIGSKISIHEFCSMQIFSDESKIISDMLITIFEAQSKSKAVLNSLLNQISSSNYLQLLRININKKKQEISESILHFGEEMFKVDLGKRENSTLEYEQSLLKYKEMAANYFKNNSNYASNYIDQFLQDCKSYHLHKQTLKKQVLYSGLENQIDSNNVLNKLPQKNCSFEAYNYCRYLFEFRYKLLKYYNKEKIDKSIKLEYNFSSFNKLQLFLVRQMQNLNFCRNIPYNIDLSVDGCISKKITSIYPESHVFSCYSCKTQSKAKGFIAIAKSEINFIHFYPYLQQEKADYLFKNLYSPYKQIIQAWKFYTIKQFQPKRYIHEKNSLEIVFVSGKSLLLEFESKLHREKFLSIILEFKSEMPNLEAYSTLELDQIVRFSKLSEEWQNWRISNFDYIMNLNYLSGRSNNNLSQYPVFPWIISNDLNSPFDLNNEKMYRNLGKNIGTQGNQDKIKHYIFRYNDESNDEKSHFGTHYSTPMIVIEYLVRIAPYFEGNLEYFSGKFDAPERIICSIEETINSLIINIPDVRELIPQFFYLHELYLNKEQLDFGIRPDKSKVDQIILPQWANNSVHLYICNLKKAFESDYVCKFINLWIDLIFGYCQKGPDGVKAINIFLPITYEDFQYDRKSIDDAIKTQAIQFGQTPSQLFTAPHVEKNAKTEKHLTIFDKFSQLSFVSRLETTFQKVRILTAKIIFDNVLLVVKTNGDISVYLWNLVGEIKKENEKYVIKEEDSWNFRSQLLIQKISFNTFIKSKNLSLITSLYPGKTHLIFVSKDNKSLYSLQLILKETTGSLQKRLEFNQNISFIQASSFLSILIVGTIIGQIYVYSTVYNSFQLKKVFHIHNGKISTISISDNLSLFASSGNDGMIHLFKIDREISLLNTIFFYKNGTTIDSINFFNNVFAGMIILSKNLNELSVYTINGELIEIVSIPGKIINYPLVSRDCNFNDYLIYVYEKEKERFLISYEISNLRNSKLPISIGFGEMIGITNDKKSVIICFKDGTINILSII